MVRIDHEVHVYEGEDIESMSESSNEEVVRLAEDNGRLRNEAASLRSQVEELRSQLRRVHTDKAMVESHLSVVTHELTQVLTTLNRAHSDSRLAQIGLSDTLRKARLWTTNG